jgi:branched-chain amino acid transport system substrate-binding protein
MKLRTYLTRLASGLLAFTLAFLGFAGLSGGPSGAATEAPINIGYICSCTSALASSIEVNRQAYEAYVSYTNAHGGIDGHQIKLFLADDSANPATASAQVHTFVTQDHIVGLVSLSNAPQAFDTYIAGLKIPVLGADGSGEDMYTNSDFFFPGQTDDSLSAAVVLAAKKVNAKKFAIMYCAESPSCQELVAPEKAAATKYKEDLAYITQISYSAPNYDAQCLAAKQAGATVLFVADAVTVVQKVASDCASQGYKPTIVASDGAVGKQFPTSPGLESGLLAFEPQIPFNVDSTPATKTMLAAFKKYQPTLMSNPNYNGEVDEAWVSGLMLTKAVQLGHPSATITSKEILAGLHSFKNQTLGGMAPPLTYTAGKVNTTDCWFWLGTKNGQFNEPYGLTPECVPGS